MFTIDFSSATQSELAIQAVKVWNNSIDNNSENLFWGIVGKILEEPFISKNFLMEYYGHNTWNEFAKDGGLWNWFFELDKTKLIKILNVSTMEGDVKEKKRNLVV